MGDSAGITEPPQITQIRQWLAGEYYPEHETFSFGHGFGEALIAAWDNLAAPRRVLLTLHIDPVEIEIDA